MTQGLGNSRFIFGILDFCSLLGWISQPRKFYKGYAPNHRAAAPKTQLKFRILLIYLRFFLFHIRWLLRIRWLWVRGYFLGNSRIPCFGRFAPPQ
ncbi:hypothetical protein [Campylobacter sp.]|uniref:hypothetical protein n=1 Tax=Campylobacter sp. TaxID=205 RepID=UPI002A756596|nr:hypothetical protein [Campylobacter sp.]